MSATSAPFGFRPVLHPSGIARPQALVSGVASGYGTNIFKGAPVIMNTNGTLTASAGNDDIVGVFWGVEYTLNLRRIFSPYWPAGLVPDTQDPYVVYYWDDPTIVYEVEGTSLAQTSIGDQADTTNPSAGSTLLGQSTGILGALKGAGVQGQWRIIGLQNYPNNAWGDVQTIVRAQIARHQYVAVKVAI